MSNGQSAVARRPAAIAWPRLLAPLLVLELGLVAGYLFTKSHVLGEQMALWFDLDQEHGVAAWFSSAQLLAIGAVLALTPTSSNARGVPAAWFLKLLALAFVFLSLDETIGIHEAISIMLRNRGSGLALGWMPLYIVIAAVGVAVSASQLLGLWRAHRSVASLFLAGALTFVGGGLVLELVGFSLGAAESPIEIMLEEYAEMAGASLMLCAALSLRERLGEPARRWG